MFPAAEGPAPGYRHRDTGMLNIVGGLGYSYSSSMSGTNGMFLDFGMKSLAPNNEYGRTSGLQMRCLSE